MAESTSVFRIVNPQHTNLAINIAGGACEDATTIEVTDRKTAASLWKFGRQGHIVTALCNNMSLDVPGERNCEDEAPVVIFESNSDYNQHFVFDHDNGVLRNLECNKVLGVFAEEGERTTVG